MPSWNTGWPLGGGIKYPRYATNSVLVWFMLCYWTTWRLDFILLSFCSNSYRAEPLKWTERLRNISQSSNFRTAPKASPPVVKFTKCCWAKCFTFWYQFASLKIAYLFLLYYRAAPLKWTDRLRAISQCTHFWATPKEQSSTFRWRWHSLYSFIWMWNVSLTMQVNGRTAVT